MSLSELLSIKGGKSLGRRCRQGWSMGPHARKQSNCCAPACAAALRWPRSGPSSCPFVIFLLPPAAMTPR